MACIEIPPVPRLKAVRDDATANFADGALAVKEWLESLPADFDGKPFRVREAADLLNDMLELVKS